MRDPRINDLAKQLVNNSVEVKAGEVVLIEYDGQAAREQAIACAELAIKVGAIPIVQEINMKLRRFLLNNGSANQYKILGQAMLDQMKTVAVYIAIRGSENMYDLKGADEKNLDSFTKLVQSPVVDHRVEKTRWVVTRFANDSMAQMAEMSTEEFTEQYFKVCCLDYRKMAKACEPLKDLMNKTDKVRIVGPETDISFSIKDIPSIPCVGERNIPDGECFTAPVKTSVNGTVFFNARTYDRESATTFEHIKATFENGKVVKAEAEEPAKTKILNGILDRDEGARYIGEFAIAFNPHILHPINDILYDEKIQGSFHMALGRAYGIADNGNDSVVHWDLIQIQRPEYGGGEIYFDDKLIRKDGVFTIPELAGLNPDKLGS